MRLSACDRRASSQIASSTDTDVKEVRKAVCAFFDFLLQEFRSLPFDDESRIYAPSSFESLSKVFNIPYVGRVGTMYSKYRRWRASEASSMDLIPRVDMKSDSRGEMIERATREALSGRRVDTAPFHSRIPSGRYRTVWLVRGGRRKAARQVIKKH